MSGPGLHFIGDEERKLVLEVLEDRQLSRYRPAGLSKVDLFEKEIATYLGASHCLAMNSCTSALTAGLLAAGIRPGDEVLVPGYTFIASVSAIVHARATPVLCEIDESLTLDPEDVQLKITPATKAILAVHMLGAACNMDALMSIAQKHGLLLIEDVAQACGGEYGGRKLGTFGAFGAFSLNVFKTITAGDGGWLATESSALYERAFALHDHGFMPGRAPTTGVNLFGMNLKMNELTGAVALAQARKLQLIIDTLRHQKQALSSAIGEVRHAQRRHLNDSRGECGTVLVLSFDTAERARAVAGALKTRTLVDSGRHNYANMHQLFAMRSIGGHGCPFDCPAHLPTQRYVPAMLPRTDDLLSRSIALSVGVNDAYLGPSFGINVLSSPAEIEQRGREFHELTSGLL
jgi:dTDP-4-amino-4,6-dideoxygalactose transaminase